MDYRSKRTLRQVVRGAYDLQKVRIMIGNRVVNNFKAKLGQVPGKKLTDKEANRFLKLVIMPEYRSITDAIADLRERNVVVQLEKLGTGVISDEIEYMLVQHYAHVLRDEKETFSSLEGILDRFPIWAWLKTVKGIGPAMAGVIISELDPTTANHISSFWKYAGMDVGPDGRGRGMWPEHLVKVRYKAKDGTEKEKNSITFNPFLKAKLIGVLVPRFLMAKNERYSEIYYNRRHRVETDQARMERMAATVTAKLEKKGKKVNTEKPVGLDAYIHTDACRITAKQFLADLWVEWRKVEGLEVTPTYAEAKLGMVHHAGK